MDFWQLIKSWLLLSLGVVIAAHTATGISYEGSGSLVVAVLLLSVCNIVLKPILMLFSLPFIILTFGVGIWLINAVLFLLVARLVEGFEVASFGNALWGALVVSVTGALASLMFGTSRIQVSTGRGNSVNRPQVGPGRPGVSATSRRRSDARKPKNDDDDVIDI